MNRKKWFFYVVVPFVLALLIKGLMSRNALWAEWYVTHISNPLVQKWSQWTGIFSFSLHEVGIFFLILFILGNIVWILYRSEGLSKTMWKRFSFRIFTIASIGYLLFVLVWGVSYHRVPFAHTFSFSDDTYSKEEMLETAQYFAENVNTLRDFCKTDDNGVMKMNGTVENALTRASKGYQEIRLFYPTLRGTYGVPKSLGISLWMNYTGITGVYGPFTGEANVNTAVPHSTMLFTTLHEMAHQRSYASENEANFIAFLAAIHHPDADYRYAGWLQGWVYIRNAIATTHPDQLDRVNAMISKRVQRDVEARRLFWERYEGNVNEWSTRINDTFLKSNGVESGVKSYGEVASLLLHYYHEVEKTKGKIDFSPTAQAH